MASFKKRQIQIITIEGNIGSGKSTLLENICTKFESNPNIVFLKEPVGEWETVRDSEGTTMLQKFYADQKKYSFPFQMMAYITRLVSMRQSIEDNPQATIFFTERSLYTDKHVFAKMLYDMGNIEDVNYQIYTQWFDAFAKDYPIDKVIYVKTDPEICYERIHIRSRTGEGDIPQEYLEQCHNYHEAMIQTHFQNIETLTISGNINIHENLDVMQKWLTLIEKFIM